MKLPLPSIFIFALLLTSCGGIGEMYSDLLSTVPICVDGVNGNDANDGRGWANALKSIQAGIDKVKDGGEIWAAGSFIYPSGSPGLTAISSRNNISIYGGFNGTESRREERNINNKTPVKGYVSTQAVQISNSSGIIISGFLFTIQNNHAINISGNCQSSITDCDFIECSDTSAQGSAIITFGTNTLDIKNCYFYKNTSGSGDSGGAVYLVNGATHIESCIFDQNVNSGASGGGAIGASSTTGNSSILINNSSFTGNKASSQFGGAIFNIGCRFTINNCTFNGNTASNYGGAIYNALGAICNVNNSSFTLNKSSSSGGAISNDNGNISIKKCSFTKNTSVTNAGAILLNTGSSCSIDNSTFTLNTSDVGGAIYNYDALSITDSVFTENSAPGSGGAIGLASASVTDITRSTFTSNTTAAGNGGAIYQNSNNTVNIYNSSFTRNSAGGSGGAIGTIGISNTAAVKNIYSCSFLENSSLAFGGAVYIHSSSPSTIINTLFYANTGPYGGAIAIDATSTHRLSNLTFYKNSALNEGGATRFANTPGLSIYNSVYFDNTSAIDKNCGISSGSLNTYNCAFDGGMSSSSYSYNCISLSESPFVSIEPLKAGFLRPSDVLVNKGASPAGFTIPDLDLAGKPRVVERIIDIGAYERQ